MPPPIVETATTKEIRSVVCPERDCVVFGYSNARTGRIYLNDSFNVNDNPVYQSRLLHELVHFLQLHALGSAEDCIEQRKREFEAYQVQRVFLWREHRIHTQSAMTMTRLYRCNSSTVSHYQGRGHD